MNQVFSLTRVISISYVFLIKLTDQCQSQCHSDADHAYSARKYHAEMSTIMLHHELRWPPANTSDVVVYTVQYQIGDLKGWDCHQECRDLTTRICDVNTHDDFQTLINFEFRVVGRINGTNQTIYVTEPIFFNKITNMTLIAPFISISQREDDGILFVHAALGESEWKRISDEKNLDVKEYEVQYWNGGEHNVKKYNKSQSLTKSSEISIPVRTKWTCVRARFYLKVKLYLEVEYPQVDRYYSPWSKTNCTYPLKAMPEVSMGSNFNILVPCLVIITLAIIVSVALLAKKIWGSVCKQFMEKTPLPDAIAKIIYNDDTLEKCTDNAILENNAVEVFDPLEYDNNNHICVTLETTADCMISPVVESVVNCSKVPTFHIYENETAPPCNSKYNMTYGIGCSQDYGHECFTDELPCNIDAEQPPHIDRLFLYRSTLSSTSTTSTLLSPINMEERSVDDWCGSVACRGSQIPEGVATNIRSSSLTERIRDFEGFNIAYSSNPMRDVPDLLYSDGNMVEEQEHADM